jgi:P27 family predicted phage terminase small subunit
MGIRGPRANTDAENKLRGNPGGRKSKNTASHVVKALGKVPPAPKHLSRVAGCEWRRLAKELFEYGKLTPENLKALEMYCQNYAIWRECEKKVEDEGRVTVATKSGYKMPHPAVAIGNKAQDAAMKWLKVLRDTHPAKKIEKDPLSEFMEKGKKLEAVK